MQSQRRLETAILQENVDEIMNLLNSGCAISSRALGLAISCQLSDVAMEFVLRRCELSENILDSAIQNRYHELVTEMLSRGCPTTPYSIGIAISQNQPLIVATLLNYGCRVPDRIHKLISNQHGIYLSNPEIAEIMCQDEQLRKLHRSANKAPLLIERRPSE